MNVVILGGGGHGRVVIDIVEKAGRFRLLGVVDAVVPVGQAVLGYEVLGRDADLSRLVERHPIEGIVIAVGDNWARSRAVAAVRGMTPRIAMPNVIHPSASIAKGFRLGQGNVVMAGAVVNSGATLGDFCIVNIHASVDHDARLGDYASLAPHACAGANVEIGEFTAVGLGAHIVRGRKIGAHTVVGAGATVLDDLPPHVVAYGTPARKIRDRQAGERYL